jgi:hypothetical protein
MKQGKKKQKLQKRKTNLQEIIDYARNKNGNKQGGGEGEGKKINGSKLNCFKGRTNSYFLNFHLLSVTFPYGHSPLGTSTQQSGA